MGQSMQVAMLGPEVGPVPRAANQASESPKAYSSSSGLPFLRVSFESPRACTPALFAARRLRSGDLDGPVVEDHQLSGAQSQRSVGMPLVIAELDLEYIGSQVLYHGADLSTVQTVVRKIFGRCHDVKYV